jgi:hypothetical protein
MPYGDTKRTIYGLYRDHARLARPYDLIILSGQAPLSSGQRTIQAAARESQGQHNQYEVLRTYEYTRQLSLSGDKEPGMADVRNSEG